MRLSGENLAISCVLVFILAACQITNPPPNNQSTPQIQLSGSLLVDEGVFSEVYDETQAGVVSVRRYDDGRVIFGSGFIVDDSGHVLTNYHVVSGGGEIELIFSTGLMSLADLIGFDEEADLAVLAAQEMPEELAPLPLGNSGKLKVGQIVLAIGTPIGLQNTMTSGIISGLGRYSRTFGKVDEREAFANASLVQTDASINQGNSGGPLLDLGGQVIGITSARLTSGFDRSVSGIGFATSSDVINEFLPPLIQNGEFIYPYLGILSIGDTSLADLQALGLVGQSGVYVAEIIPDSPAERAGLVVGTQITHIPGIRSGGDLIIRVDDQDVATFEELMAYIVLNKRPGDVVTLTVMRGSEEMELELQLGTRPQE